MATETDQQQIIDGLRRELEARTAELAAARAQQAATADVLKIINRSAFDLQTVLQTLTESAARLCNADMGAIARKSDEGYYHATNYNFPVDWVRVAQSHKLQPGRGSVVGRALLANKAVQIIDALADPEYAYPDMQEAAAYRTLLGVPMMRQGEPIGVLFLGRKTVEAFTERQIELVSTFADQAVIAIENARLFDEVQARTRDLQESLQQQTATAEVLKVISRSAFDLQSVFNTLTASATELCEADTGIIFLRDGDLFRAQATSGARPEFLEFLKARPRRRDDKSMVPRVARAGAVVHIPDVALDPDFQFQGHEDALGRPVRSILGVPLLRNGVVEGVFVVSHHEVKPFTQRQIELVEAFSDQAVIAIENVRLFDEVQARTRELTQSLHDLRAAQDRLIQTEKLASLGQLTAGIAHEIKNPLNFVNNFAALSVELTDELNDLLKHAKMSDDIGKETDELTGLLKDNLSKVVQHGKRADSIVKNMLLHSREGSGEHRPADINALVDESLNLAYHGARAEKPHFNVTLERDFDPEAGMIEVFPQEITRVFLNLISNGFYAVSKRKADRGAEYFEPTITATTKGRTDRVEICIRDNGTGIPAEVKEKMFNPFFTTKPAGEGTGLGLSMSHDIIVKQHGGTIDVDTLPGEFTEFTIVLPRTSNLSNKSRG
jgi:two-component system, NtrC family, sensor kinase